VIPHLIPVPTEAAGATFGSSVAIQIVSTTILSASSLTTGPGVDKPVVWSDDVPLPLAGLDFTTGPYGAATAFWLIGGIPYVSGYVRPFPPGKFPAPTIWAGSAMQRLSTADPALGWGAAETLAIRFEHAYVAGETYRNVPSGGPLLSIPAWWDNGSRHDLAGLVPSGAGPAVSQPLFGWWRVPGTPMTSPPDWPYVGGFAEVAAAPAAVAAAGSGVAKVIGLVPKK